LESAANRSAARSSPRADAGLQARGDPVQPLALHRLRPLQQERRQAGGHPHQLPLVHRRVPGQARAEAARDDVEPLLGEPQQVRHALQRPIGVLDPPAPLIDHATAASMHPGAQVGDETLQLGQHGRRHLRGGCRRRGAGGRRRNRSAWCRSHAPRR
jgi:hypothetical protein